MELIEKVTGERVQDHGKLHMDVDHSSSAARFQVRACPAPDSTCGSQRNAAHRFVFFGALLRA